MVHRPSFGAARTSVNAHSGIHDHVRSALRVFGVYARLGLTRPYTLRVHQRKPSNPGARAYTDVFHTQVCAESGNIYRHFPRRRLCTSPASRPGPVPGPSAAARSDAGRDSNASCVARRHRQRSLQTRSQTDNSPKLKNSRYIGAALNAGACSPMMHDGLDGQYGL